jgi:hypothetical protein
MMHHAILAVLLGAAASHLKTTTTTSSSPSAITTTTTSSSPSAMANHGRKLKVITQNEVLRSGMDLLLQAGKTIFGSSLADLIHGLKMKAGDLKTTLMEWVNKFVTKIKELVEKYVPEMLGKKEVVTYLDEKVDLIEESYESVVNHLDDYQQILDEHQAAQIDPRL